MEIKSNIFHIKLKEKFIYTKSEYDYANTETRRNRTLEKSLGFFQQDTSDSRLPLKF
jgi:hypothetical protein